MHTIWKNATEKITFCGQTRRTQHGTTTEELTNTEKQARQMRFKADKIPYA